MPSEEPIDESIVLKLLVFQMFSAGHTQDEIAGYLKKSKRTINAILKPLQRKGKATA
jgi:hypothetical protein